jgi:uncharacterized protein (TIGR02001 family)
MSKKTCLGAKLPQCSNNLQEIGIFRLLEGPVFVLWWRIGQAGLSLAPYHNENAPAQGITNRGLKAMARGSCFAGIIKSGILSAALIAGLAAPGYAGDPPKLTLSGSATFVTDYMFRSISNTDQDPAAQPEFDLTYGMWWAYIWGSNTAFGGSGHVEIDYGVGISPKWGPVTFTIGALYYTYPGDTGGGGVDLDYLEVKTGASWTSGAWTFAVNNYWSPDNFNLYDNSDAIEGTIGYAWTGKLWNFFTPSISGTFGHQAYESLVHDYNYWNVGMTFAFLEHWSLDARYYDTDYSEDECFANSGGRNNCDARAVGALKVTF